MDMNALQYNNPVGSKGALLNNDDQRPVDKYSNSQAFLSEGRKHALGKSLFIMCDILNLLANTYSALQVDLYAPQFDHNFL